MAKKLPLVTATIEIKSWHGEKAEGEPGHSTLIEATYRDLPEHALLALQKVGAGAIEQMTQFGEAELKRKNS